MLILDEPFSGLDPINVNLIRNFLAEFRAKGKTIVFSTHVLEQAEKLCDHICLITKSKKVLDGDLKALKRAFAGNVMRVSTDASADAIRAIPGVASVAAVNGGFHVALADGAEARAVVQRLFEKHRVDAFSEKEPELEEIYLKAVADAGLEETRTI